MPRLPIKLIAPAIILGTLLLGPPSVSAAINPDAQSAAGAGIQYLANNQQANGGISGFGGESEWSVEAIKAAGQDPSTFAHNGSAALLDFLKADVPTASTSTTTVERKIIAIAAAGQDPTSFGSINYDALLENQHVSNQIGDPTLLNDDIFGIIAIDAAQAGQLQAEAQDALNFLLAHQGADGGFSYSADSTVAGSDGNDTAAAIIAMYAAQHLGLTAAGLDTARSNALTYLLSTQQADGGFAYDGFSPSDGSSTAWSLMALNTIGDSVSTQATLARTWLLQDQNADGGFSYGAFGITNSDTYTTAHAVTALLGSTWLLRPTPLTATQPPTGGSSSQSSSAAVSTATPPAPTPPTVQQPAAAITASFDDTSASTAGDTIAATADTLPASTPTQPKHKTASTITNTSKKLPGYTIYGVGLLALVALIWLVVEFAESPEA